MQLASSLFGVLVVQLKPQVEAVLGLEPGALTKEIALTEQLMEFFMQYQIPTDMFATGVSVLRKKKKRHAQIRRGKKSALFPSSLVVSLLRGQKETILCETKNKGSVLASDSLNHAKLSLSLSRRARRAVPRFSYDGPAEASASAKLRVQRQGSRLRSLR